MKTKARVQIVNTDDWQIMYVNGVKVTEGHSLDAGDVVNALIGVYPEYYSVPFDNDPRYDGCTPETFNDKGLVKL